MGDDAAALQQMVDDQIRARGVVDPLVLTAMATVPRQAFVPDDVAHLATVDRPLPIGDDQTISQPYIVALMAEAAVGGRVSAGHVLEIGTGCGYGAAVLARVADDVVTVERHATLAGRARATLDAIGATGIEVVVGDGTLGHADAAPYDAIVVTAAGPTAPPALIDQLAPGGRLVAPIGDRDDQEMVVLARTTTGGLERSSLGAVRFVPLIGDQGWDG